jgi:Ca-activated chloride channel homolog
MKVTKKNGVKRKPNIDFNFRGISFFILTMVFFLLNYPILEVAFAQDELPEDLNVSIAQFDAEDYPEITLYVNITDSAGNYITGLTSDDFEILEDEEKVELSDFAGIGDQRAVDVVFVFDTTGSMGEEISGLIQTCISFAEELESKGRDYRLGLVTFSDEIRSVFYEDSSLTEDVETFRGWVSGLKAEGGDQEPENSYAALHRASQMNFRGDAQSVLILITDATPHRYGDPTDDEQTFDDPKIEYQAVLNQITENNISIYAITPYIDDYRYLATETGGNYYNIAENPDFTGVIEDIGAVIANQYRITYHSPRPTYDGTRRDVIVRIGSAEESTGYHEQHLLNIQSNCLVGLLCLFPLFLAFLLPLTVQMIAKRSRSEILDDSIAAPQPVQDEKEIPYQQDYEATLIADTFEEKPRTTPKAPSELSADTFLCKNCGNPLRANAKFCPKCGTPVLDEIEATEMISPKVDSDLAYCPNCGQKLRPGAKFCNNCGMDLSSS